VPADIVGGFQGFIQTRLEVQTWEGEVPRRSVDGTPICPDDQGFPNTWPVVVVKMPEGGMHRKWTTEDPYKDEGPLEIRVYGVTRKQVLDVVTEIEGLLASASGRLAISLNGDVRNPYYVIDCLLERWSVFQRENERTMQSNFLYEGQMDYALNIHGAVPTK
jgi:hypothetical protein